MKKRTTLLLAVALIFTLASCSMAEMESEVQSWVEADLTPSNIEDYLGIEFYYNDVMVKNSGSFFETGYTDITVTVYPLVEGYFHNTELTVQVPLPKGWMVKETLTWEGADRTLKINIQLPESGEYAYTYDLIASSPFDTPHTQNIRYTITSASGIYTLLPGEPRGTSSSDSQQETASTSSESSSTNVPQTDSNTPAETSNSTSNSDSYDSDDLYGADEDYEPYYYNGYSDEDAVNDAVIAYLFAYVEDINSGSYHEMYQAVAPGSNMETMQRNAISARRLEEELLDYNILRTQKIDANTYHVTTEEEYDVWQDKDPPYFYIRQKCVYVVKQQSDDSWKVVDFASAVEVLERVSYVNDD